MIRQKTSNTFEEGLNLDVSPLMASPKGMSNSLNATFITGDGEEGILQNDMGNYRVDRIKLDTGYIPVGMCTYGGITYIASYNPITNLGQVGSFPSPATEGWETGIKENKEVKNLTVSTPFIQQLTKDVFRPGDKFDLYSNNKIEETLVSHINNTTVVDGVTKIKSPKNKELTVSLCVLDSSGNLHDISSKVNKFVIKEDTYEILSYNSDEEILLNLGTFFKIKNTSNISSTVDDNYTENEPDLIFNSKISSNLFLVYKINSLASYNISAEFFKPDNQSYLDMSTIDSSNFNSEDKVESNLIGILFLADYLYNSPDDYYEDNLLDSKLDENSFVYHSSNLKYLSDFGVKSDFGKKVLSGLTFYIDEKESINLPFNPTEADIKPIYDYTEKLYRVTHKYWYIYDKKEDKVKLNFIPTTIYGNIPEMKLSILVNLNDIGSGKIQVTDWKYYIDNNNNIILNYKIDSYPYTGTKLSNVRLEFYNLSTNNFSKDLPTTIFTTEARSSYHGLFFTYFDYDNTELVYGNMYLVIFKYDLLDNKNVLISENNIFDYKTFLHTLLYNDMYNDLRVSDYNNIEGIDDLNSTSLENKTLYKKYHNYTPKANVIISEEKGSATNESNNILSLITSGKRFITSINKVQMTATATILGSSLEQQKYPFSLDVTKSTINSITVESQSPSIDIWERFNDLKKELSKNDLLGTIYANDKGVGLSENDSSFDTTITGIKISNIQEDASNRISFDIEYGPSYIANKINTGTQNIIISNPYVKYGELYGSDMYSNGKWITPAIDWALNNGPDDFHAARYVSFSRFKVDSKDYYTASDLPSDILGDSVGSYSQVFRKHDGLVTFTLKDFLEIDQVNNYFDDDSIIYIYNDTTVNKRVTTNNSPNDNLTYLYVYSRGNANTVNWTSDSMHYILWKVNGKWYHIKTNKTPAPTPECDGSKSPNSLEYRIKEFFGKFVIPSTGSVQYSLSKIPDISKYMYSKAYNTKLKYTIKATLQYDIKKGSESYNTLVSNNLNALKLDKDITNKLNKYINFNILNSGGQIVINEETTFSIPGAESIHLFINSIASGVFDLPAFVYDDGNGNKLLLLYDNNGNSLLLNSLYVLNGKLLEKSTNSAISSYLKYQNGKIVPNNSYTMQSVLLVYGGASSDSKTKIMTGRFNQIELNI